MRKLTADEMGVLSQYEKVFNTVLYAQYKRGTTQNDDKTVHDILEAVTGEGIARNYGCSVCVFNIYKRMAQIYYDQKNKEIQKQVNDALNREAERNDTRRAEKAKKGGGKENKVR